MMKTSQIKMIVFLVLGIGWMIIGNSCANPEFTADQMLEDAIFAVSAQNNFTFKGNSQVSIAGAAVQQDVSFEGFVAEDNRLYIKVNSNRESPLNPNSTETLNKPSALAEKWNPLDKMDQLKILNKSATVNDELSSATTTVIDASVNGEQYTAQFKKELRAQQNIILEPYIDEARNQHQLSDQELASMRREMQQSISDAAQKLDAILETISAKGNYRIWIDPKTGLPQKMQVVTDINYAIGEQDRQETVKLNYIFQGYGKDS